MKISVIVPVYNVKSSLKRCVDSLLAQTCPDLELILVDDGSVDGSGALCDSYAALPNIKVLHQENAGLGMARNSGLAAAGGEYAAFVDSDDYIGPDLLENLYAAAKNRDADISIGGFTPFDSGGRKRPVPCAKTARIFADAGIRELMLNTAGALPGDCRDSKYGMAVWGRLYRRSVIEQYGLRFVSERELISEDLIFNLMFLKHAHRAVVTTDTAYFYRVDGDSLSKRHRPDRFWRDYELYLAVEKMLAEEFEVEEYEPYLQRLLISRARFDIVQEVICHDKTDCNYPLRQSVKAICNHPALRAALEKYPWKSLPKMQGIFTLMMKRERINALIWLARARRIIGR